MNEIAVSNKTEVIQPIVLGTITEYLDSTGLTKKLQPSEKAMFIQIAQLYGLNPFKREIYCNVYGQGDKRQCSIITGYEVYLKRADRIGKLDGWETTLAGKVSDGSLSATVIIYRKDWSHPFKHTVYYREVVQTTKEGNPNRFWKTQPTFMTRKVAVAQAFRLCFPDEFGGMPYTNDEMGVEESAPVVERNVTPTNEQIESELDPKENSERQKLITIIEKYETEMTRSEQKPTPYDMCCEALAENDPAKISNMLTRSIAYLGRQGIQVA